MFIAPPYPELTQIARQMAAARSFDEVIAALRDCARVVVGADGIAVSVREGDLCRYVAEDANQLLWSGTSFPLANCVSGQAMLSGETIVVPDVEADPRVPLEPYAGKTICSVVIVPIGSPRPIAALDACWCAMVWPDEACVFRLEAVAKHAGAALARLQDALH